MFVREVCRNYISSRRFYIKHIPPSSSKLLDLPGVSYILNTHDRLKSRELGSLKFGPKLSCMAGHNSGGPRIKPQIIWLCVRLKLGNLETWIEVVSYGHALRMGNSKKSWSSTLTSNLFHYTIRKCHIATKSAYNWTPSFCMAGCF